MTIVYAESQTGPSFKDNPLFTRLTRENIKIQLYKMGNKLEELPTNQTI